MRFIGNASHLYEHAGSQMYGCEFICWGYSKEDEKGRGKKINIKHVVGGKNQMLEATKCT